MATTAASRNFPSLTVSARIGLVKLPTEVVHQIFDDLQVIQILKIVSHRMDHLDHCVLTHPVYQHVFPEPSVLDEIRDLFETYHEICQHIRCTQSPKDSVLSRNLSTSPVTLTTAELRDYLGTRVQDFLSKGDQWLSLLATFSTARCPPVFGRSPVDMRKRWLWIREAEAAINIAKSKELHLVANLLDSEAGRAILKTPLDPDQGSPRKNFQHIVSRLRGDAKKVLKDRILAHRFNSRRHWGIDNLPLIPYDRHLEAFTHMISNQKGELDAITKDLQKTAVADDSDVTAEKVYEQNREANLILSKEPYPVEIALDISVVTTGLYNVYMDRGITSLRPTLPRILTGPSYACFVIYPPKKNIASWDISSNRFAVSRQARPDTAAPHDEREIVWLEAFVRVVAWMGNDKSLG